ncbi:hypothetical protein ACEYW6_33385 [Nostoc sp. UIC 10607]
MYLIIDASAVIGSHGKLVIIVPGVPMETTGLADAIHGLQVHG